MSKSKLLLISPIIILTLSGCYETKPIEVKTAVLPSTREKVQQSIKAVCPQPLKPSTLNVLAGIVEKDTSTFLAIQDVNRMDDQARICRGSN